jgi:hypothetical protein
MRKLCFFGISEGKDPKTYFEWPKEKEILEMPIDMPIEAIGLNWHQSDAKYLN